MKIDKVIGGLIFTLLALTACQNLPIQQLPQASTSAPAAETIPTPPNSAANTLIGTVQDVVSNTLLIKTEINSQYRVQILPETRIWKGNWDNNDRVIEVGDGVVISGTMDGHNKSGVAQELYVNIVNTYGLISDVEIQASEIHFIIHDGYTAQPIHVKIDRNQMVASSAQSGEITADAIEWQKVKRGQVVGLRLKDGTVQGETVSVDYQ